MRSLPGRRATIAVVFGLAAVCAIAPHTSAQAGPASCEQRNNNQYRKLLECVNGAGVEEHLEAFQAIAEANAVEGVPTRADQTPGYDASVAYVVDTMTAAGWEVDVVPFTYNAATVTLEQLTPVRQDWVAFDAVGTGEGDVNGNVIPVDINIAEGVGNNANSSGCDGAVVATTPGVERLRRDRLERPERHRLDPAWHLLFRRQGPERRSGRCRGGRVVQPGQPAVDAGQRPFRSGQPHARTVHVEHPRGRHHLCGGSVPRSDGCDGSA